MPRFLFRVFFCTFSVRHGVCVATRGASARTACRIGHAAPDANIDDRRAHGRHAEDRRLLPALLGRAHRLAVPRDPALDTEFLYSTRARGRPRLERHRPRSRQRRRRHASSRSSASARACCWCSRTSRSARAARTRSSASRSRTRSRSRCCGASRSPAETQRPRARRRHRLPAARRAPAPAARCGPGNYRVDRTRSAFYLPRTKAFPEEHRIEMTLTFVNDAGRRTRRRRRPDRSRARTDSGRRRRPRRRRRRTRRRPVLRHRSPASRRPPTR